jgi:hypothetical protein
MGHRPIPESFATGTGCPPLSDIKKPLTGVFSGRDSPEPLPNRARWLTIRRPKF